MRSALIWDITQTIVVIPYLRFGRTYRFPSSMVKNYDPCRWDR